MPLKRCSMEGCELLTKARGLCQRHYAKAARLANPNRPRIAIKDIFRGEFPRVRLALRPEDIFGQSGSAGQ
jgi:hypothetical protein